MTGVAPYVIGRLLQSAVLLAFIVTIGFFVIRTAPGDPVLYLYGAQNISADTLAALRQVWGFDRPLAEQYWIYVTNVASGNLGYSQVNREQVSAILLRNVPNTLLLMAPSILLAAAGGVVLGTTASRRLNTPADYIIGAVSMVGYSMPPFWLAILLIVIFASTLRWLPTQGMSTLGASDHGVSHVVDVARHMVLPVAVLTWWYLAAFARLTRASMLEESRKPYLMTARMKGLSENRVFYGHALRNASRPVLTMLGVYLGTMLAGAVMTEVVFAWPGMGRLTFSAIVQRDYPVVLAVFIVSGAAVVTTNLIIDVLYAVVDPRIRHA